MYLAIIAYRENCVVSLVAFSPDRPNIWQKQRSRNATAARASGHPRPPLSFGFGAQFPSVLFPQHFTTYSLLLQLWIQGRAWDRDRYLAFTILLVTNDTIAGICKGWSNDFTKKFSAHDGKLRWNAFIISKGAPSYWKKEHSVDMVDVVDITFDRKFMFRPLQLYHLPW